MASDHPEGTPEDLKAASALANLTGEATPHNDGDVDQAAVSAAMKQLGGKGKGGVSLPVRRNVTIDQADVALLIDQLDVTKGKATDLLKAHDGNAAEAMKAFVQVGI